MSFDVQIVKRSFESAKPWSADIADYFYSTLMKDYPDSTPLFEATNMVRQKQALIGSLVFIVDNIEDGEKLIPYLKKMGARHLSYGVQPEHYEWVGASFIKTLVHFFGENWTTEMESSWSGAFTVIAENMLAGAAESVTQQPQLKIELEQEPSLLSLPESARKQLRSYAREKIENAVQAEFTKILAEEMSCITESEIEEMMKKVA